MRFILLLFGIVAMAADKPLTVRTGKYHCTLFAGHLQTVPGFEIQSSGAYTHQDGSRGSYKFNPAESLIVFEGGSLNGQAALYDTKGARPAIGIYNERRSRTVIDCEAP